MGHEGGAHHRPTRVIQEVDSFGETEYREIAEYCEKIGIDFCSTAFDDYLESMMDVYKVSSSDLTNHPFIEYQAKKGKQMIVSVGAAELDEMRAAVEVIRRVNDQLLVLCHCVLEYPTPYPDAKLEAHHLA